MTTERVERRLSAIVSADVVGYSKLMARDEVATVKTLNSYRIEITSIVERHGGRVVDSPGDNILLEFPSATGAVEAALEAQARLAERNSNLPLDRNMEFRMGVHLGEVLVEGDRIYGDGVNLAARLEAIAKPGGICVSRAVRDQVGSKTEVIFVDLGYQYFKSVTEPVGVFEARSPDSQPAGRHTAVIASVKVSDYERLVAVDREGTISALRGHRVASEPLVYSHGGRVASERGLWILYEFPSVAEAVRSGRAVQALMKERNESAPEGRRMSFKLGIHVGEVEIGQTGEVEGPAVEMVRRIMELSNPGGLWISEMAYQKLDTDLKPDFSNLGDHRFADLNESLELWGLNVRLDSASEERALGEGSSGAGAIVVLPFERLGGDPQQDYLVDGITEDLTTALTSYREFHVVPRSSAFSYRNEDKTDREIARELDATYVLRGSARVVGERVRISSHLVDVESDHVLWSERFDREMEDIFALQDEIAESITLRIAPEMLREEVKRSLSRDSGSLESWDLFQRGKWHYYQTSRKHYDESVSLLEQAIEKDSNNGDAMAFLAFVLTVRIWRGWSDDVPGDFRRAIEVCEHAVRLDPTNWRARASLAVAYAFTGQHDRAQREAEQSLPWYPTAMGLAAWQGGELDTAIEYLMRAVQLSPRDPDSDHWKTGLAFVHYMAGNYPAALTWGEQAQRGLPDYIQLKGILAATLAQLGRLDEARSYLDDLLEALPGLTADVYRTRFRIRDSTLVDRYMEGLVKAGLPPS
jgi:adenylate cyclase